MLCSIHAVNRIFFMYMHIALFDYLIIPSLKPKKLAGQKDKDSW